MEGFLEALSVFFANVTFLLTLYVCLIFTVEDSEGAFKAIILVTWGSNCFK